MSQQQPAERYQQLFDDIDRIHLLETRKLRSQIRRDEQLPDLERAVLGVTGSLEILGKWARLSRLATENVGQPIVVLTQPPDAPNLHARAGIIAGEARVDFSSNWQDTNTISAAASLRIPVEASVAYERGRILSPGEYPPGTLTVASVIMREASNHADDPEQDFQSDGLEVCIGKHLIYYHPRFQQGIGDMLIALDNAMPVPNTAGSA